MKRRTLLKSGLAASSLALTSSPSSAHTPSTCPSPEVPPFELDEVDIAELQRRLESGEETSLSLVGKYLRRIEQADRDGPALNSVIEVNPDAEEIARGRDRERSAGHLRGPLHGVPVMLKDNIDTADRMRTSAGSLALAESIAAHDSGVAAKLRAAGAVILAKTNLSEWANFRSNSSTSGWSARGGLTKNPYALDRNPCGSSSGSGVAVAASLCAAAIGTETNGSIVCPANANGIVGIKPTVGLVSRAGIIPISSTQDTVGPMARSVTDAATLLGVLIGADPSDPATAASEGYSHSDYTQFLEADGLPGARIGVARGYGEGHPHVDKLFEDALAAIKSAGAEVIDPLELPSPPTYVPASVEVMKYEFKAGLNTYLESLGPSAPIKNLSDLIAFNLRHADRELPYFGQEILEDTITKGPLTGESYLAALTGGRDLIRAAIDAVMAEHQLDALIAPTGGPAWLTDLINGDNFSTSSSSPAAVSGYPNVTVPMGFVFGLPVGISFFGRAWTEPALIRLAYAFEQAAKHRKPPKFLPTAELT